jgi:hypothetical protein
VERGTDRPWLARSSTLRVHVAGVWCDTQAVSPYPLSALPSLGAQQPFKHTHARQVMCLPLQAPTTTHPPPHTHTHSLTHLRPRDHPELVLPPQGHQQGSTGNQGVSRTGWLREGLLGQATHK